RRLDEMHLPVISRAGMVGRQLFRIGRPRDRTERVCIAFRAIEAQRGSRLARTGLAKEHVVVLDQGFPLAVERRAHLRFCGSLSGRRRGSSAAAPPASAAALSLRRALGARRARALSATGSEPTQVILLRRWWKILEPVLGIAANHLGRG